jgi:predicted adenine nucleotide alpha hydrolase (AANH) superfamily ATPase
MSKPRILVHVCCAPDAAYVIGLLQEDYDVTGFFYNPNIHPAEEYALRLLEAKKVAHILDVRLVEDAYDDTRWLALTQKFKDEPEKGRRCDVCYALRLGRTARAASAQGFDFFTTIMSLSPWKKADVLNRIGRMFGRRYGVKFLEANFKKKDGFKKSVEISRAWDIFRQDYCGCIYSRRNLKGQSSDQDKAKD